METDLLKIIEEVMQREMDRASGTHYQLHLALETKEALLGADGSVIDSYQVLIYNVSFKDMIYTEKSFFRQLSLSRSDTVAVGERNNEWSLTFPGVYRLKERATEYFKNESFKKLLDE